MAPEIGSVAFVWRGASGERVTETRNYGRLRPIFEAFVDAGIAVEPVLYSDRDRDAVRDQLLLVDGVLVWVDPIDAGDDRTELDAVLRDVSARGVWVSAHPDTIEKMGTKEVLYRTKNLGWGTDTHLYSTPAELREQFPGRLGAGHARVLKQNRGNGGLGVWKVALVDEVVTGATSTNPAANTIVRIQHAAPRDHATEDVALGEFFDRCDEFFAGEGKLIDQPFVARVSDGMVRAYLVVDQVVGFARQEAAVTTPPHNVLGLPSAKTMSDADDPTYESLKNRLEHEWVPGLRDLVDLEPGGLPLLWDADFLSGPPTDSDADSYILCEINVSSVLPFPDQAPRALALAVTRRLRVDD